MKISRGLKEYERFQNKEKYLVQCEDEKEEI